MNGYPRYVVKVELGLNQLVNWIVSKNDCNNLKVNRFIFINIEKN